MAKKEALEKLTLAAKEAQKSGANKNDIDRAVELDWPQDPGVEALSKNPKPPHDPLAGF